MGGSQFLASSLTLTSVLYILKKFPFPLKNESFLLKEANLLSSLYQRYFKKGQQTK